MQTNPEPTFTITQSQLVALMNGVQAHLNNTQAAIKPLVILGALDQQLVAVWQTFEKSLTPVPPAPPPSDNAAPV